MDNVNIENELDSACFLDLRLKKRAKKLVTDLFNGIGNSIPGSCKGKTETEAAYRFFNNELVTNEKILSSHIKSTIARMRLHKVILLIQDSTNIDAKHMKNVDGLGCIYDKTNPGCVAHTMIACTEDRLCLGVVSNKYIIREKDEIGKKSHNNRRPIEEKESYKWIAAFDEGVKISKEIPDTEFISIGDREADIIELFIKAKDINNNVGLLVRAFQNRTVEVNKDDEKIKTKLKKAVSEAESLGEIEFRLPVRGGKKGRLVKQALKATTITLNPPGHKKRIGNLEINAVYLEEIDPPKGEDPICWTLLTTLPISTKNEIERIVKLYLARWSIEVFFHILKTGCKIEKLQFDTAHNLLNCITLYMIVAWRLYFTVYLGRNCPDLSCTVIFEEDEWKSVFAVVKKTKPPEKPPTLGEVMLLIATLGGFLNRKSDGDPGPKVMWIGLMKLTECVKGWMAFRQFG